MGYSGAKGTTIDVNLAHGNIGASSFHGILDEFVIFKRANTPEEMKIGIVSSHVHRVIDTPTFVLLSETRPDIIEDIMNRVKDRDSVRRWDAHRQHVAVNQLASALIGGLAGEQIRWTEDAANFGIKIDRLVGDCAVSCAFTSYVGGFNQDFRAAMVKRFISDLQKKRKHEKTYYIATLSNTSESSENKVGPLTLEQVVERIAHGHSNATTPTWFHGLNEWVPLGRLIEFRESS